MMSIFCESKKLGRFVAPDGIECSPGFVGAIAGETERRQQLSVKLHCSLKVFHPQIDVIQNARFHLFDFRFSRRIINFNPDQVSSTAQTFTSTNPSGNAISRITSSVRSVEIPEDFFGHETQTVPFSDILSRKIDNFFCNSLRRLVKRWTKFELESRRLENATPSGIFPSNRRYFAGALMVTTVKPVLIPSFCGSGVPE